MSRILLIPFLAGFRVVVCKRRKYISHVDVVRPRLATRRGCSDFLLGLSYCMTASLNCQALGLFPPIGMDTSLVISGKGSQEYLFLNIVLFKATDSHPEYILVLVPRKGQWETRRGGGKMRKHQASLTHECRELAFKGSLILGKF